MKREDVLEIEFMPVWDRWAWRITKQDEEVFTRDDFYDDALGVYCNGNPEFIKGRNDLFILSDESDTKIGINICDEEQKKMIEEKVRLINKKYGKSWRAEKSGKYYCIDSTFDIDTKYENFKDEDEKHIIRVPSIPFFKWSEFRVGLFFKHTKAYNKVKALNFDIVHTQTEFSMGNFGTFIAKDLNIPCLHTYHTVYEEYTHYISNFGKSPLKKVVRKLSKRYIARLSGVIAPTEKTKNLLISYGVKNKIYVVPSGINLEKFKKDIPDAETDSLLKSFNIKKDSFKLIFLIKPSCKNIYNQFFIVLCRVKLFDNLFSQLFRLRII